jgi:Zn-finger protein
MDALLVTSQAMNVSNAMCYCAVYLAIACKTGNWRHQRLDGEATTSVTTPFHQKLHHLYISVSVEG